MGALTGIIVLDVSQVMAGPFCAMQMADLGADVIKVEPPEGEATRHLPGAKGSDSPGFNALNRGKRGIVLNLKKPAAQEVFRRLARTADVVIENYRPGVTEALGIDYTRISAENPRIVYGSVSGYGQTGPDASKGGFDLIAQGVSGLMSVTGEAGRPPVKCGVPVTDLGAGLFLLAGILSALFDRTRTGRGQYVDTSLLEAGLALSVWEATQYFSGGGVPGPVGSAHRAGAPYQAFRCADGYITVGAWSDRLFLRLCDVLARPDWRADPDLQTASGRIANRGRLAAAIEAMTTTRPRAHWLALFDEHDIPCGPINSYEEALNAPQTLARGMVQEVEHATLGRLRTLGSPLKLSATPAAPARPAPSLGAHTYEVLGAAGYSAAELRSLRDEGAIA